MENKTLSWQAPEFRHYEKNVGWYTTLIAVAVLVVGFFIVQKDYFAAVTMTVLALLVVLFSRQKPQMVDIELGHKHIKYGNILFPYKQIKHFWVVHNENHKTLNLETTTYINNIIILELEENDPEHVRTFLLEYIPEHPEKNHETFAQRVMHKLKF